MHGKHSKRSALLKTGRMSATRCCTYITLTATHARMMRASYTARPPQAQFQNWRGGKW